MQTDLDLHSLGQAAHENYFHHFYIHIVPSPLIQFHNNSLLFHYKYCITKGKHWLMREYQHFYKCTCIYLYKHTHRERNVYAYIYKNARQHVTCLIIISKIFPSFIFLNFLCKFTTNNNLIETLKTFALFLVLFTFSCLHW